MQPNGRGYFRDVVQKKNRTAAQVSWEIKNRAPFPDGFEACHSCDNPNCVNPDHIWVGTHKQNMEDATRKGRMKSFAPYAGVTHCKNGHEFTEENTRVRHRVLRGKEYLERRCLTCSRAKSAEYRFKIKSVAIGVLIFLSSSCASIAAAPSLENRTLRLSRSGPWFEYQYEVCSKRILGICTDHSMKVEKYDISDKVLREKLINMGFVFKVREKP